MRVFVQLLAMAMALAAHAATVPLAWDSSGPWIQSYIIYGVQGSSTNKLATVSGAVLMANVTVPDGAWTFFVTATIGSTESVPSNMLPVNAMAPPAPVINAPSAPSLLPGGYTLTVTWSSIPPNFHATNYLATISKPDGSSEAKTSSNTFAQFSGLSNGPYTVTVNALSFWGEGDPGSRAVTILGAVQKLRVP